MLVWTHLPRNWSRGTLANSGHVGGTGGQASVGRACPGPWKPGRGMDPGCSRCLTAVLDQLGSPGREGEGRGAKGSGRRGSLAAARLASKVSGEGGVWGA